MSRVLGRIPEGSPRIAFGAHLLIVGCGVPIAAATSQAADWHPVTLVLALAAFAAASQMQAVRFPGSSWSFTSTAPSVLAVTLLGPAPAVAILIPVVTAEAILGRKSASNYAANLAEDTAHAVTAGLLARWLIESIGLAPDQAGFALLVLGIYAYSVALNLLMVAGYEVLVNGGPFWELLKRERHLVAFEAPTALLAAATAYAYGSVGVGALGLLVVVMLAHEYSTQGRMAWQERAEMLQKRADELLALHATLKEQTRRLSELSESRGRLVGQVLQAEETERRRLAEALHDEALQELLFARHRLPAGTDGKSDDARLAIERAIKQLREEIFDLHPAILKNAGLAAALDEIAGHQAKRAGFRARVDVAPEACGVHDQVLFVLGREQLINAAKHAKATKVALVVRQMDHSVVMEVADNGRGIDPEHRRRALERGHIGLASSAERVEVLGGELEIESEPGGGTRIRTTLPVGK